MSDAVTAACLETASQTVLETTGAVKPLIIACWRVLLPSLACSPATALATCSSDAWCSARCCRAPVCSVSEPRCAQLWWPTCWPTLRQLGARLGVLCRQHVAAAVLPRLKHHWVAADHDCSPVLETATREFRGNAGHYFYQVLPLRVHILTAWRAHLWQLWQLCRAAWAVLPWHLLFHCEMCSLCSSCSCNCHNMHPCATSVPVCLLHRSQSAQQRPAVDVEARHRRLHMYLADCAAHRGCDAGGPCVSFVCIGCAADCILACTGCAVDCISKHGFAPTSAPVSAAP